MRHADPVDSAVRNGTATVTRAHACRKEGVAQSYSYALAYMWLTVAAFANLSLVVYQEHGLLIMRGFAVVPTWCLFKVCRLNRYRYARPIAGAIGGLRWEVMAGAYVD
jgi:hypothetical protein